MTPEQTTLFSETEQIGAAVSIMSSKMAGKLDRYGQPAVLHALRVLVKQTDHVCQTIAALHDLVKDGICTLEDLRGCFNAIVVDGVDSMTQRYREPFREYIERVALNAFAIPVKIAELWDLMDMMSRASVVANEEIDMMKEYQWAAKRLLSGRLTLQPPKQELVQIQSIK